MDKMEKDELDSGYSLDDFGLNFNENALGESRDSQSSSDAKKSRGYSHSPLQNSQDSQHHAKSHIDSLDSQAPDNEAHDYAPQFQGFDFSEAAYSGESSADFSTNFSVETNAQSRPSVFSEKDALLNPIQPKLSKQSEIGALFVAYTILFLILLLFMPQIYLANNIYYASKNINYLKSQREALRDENGDLQQKLESLKFNFLTLEIEEIK